MQKFLYSEILDHRSTCCCSYSNIPLSYWRNQNKCLTVNENFIKLYVFTRYGFALLNSEICPDIRWFLNVIIVIIINRASICNILIKNLLSQTTLEFDLIDLTISTLQLIIVKRISIIKIIWKEINKFVGKSQAIRNLIKLVVAG